MGFGRLFRLKPEVYQPPCLRARRHYAEVLFTYPPWGGRSSSKLWNLAVKQRNRVYAVPCKGCVPPHNWARTTLPGKPVEFASSQQKPAPARGNTRNGGAAPPNHLKVMGLRRQEFYDCSS